MITFTKLLKLELKFIIKKFYFFIPIFLSLLYVFYGYNIMIEQLDIYAFIRTSGFVFMGLSILSIYMGVISARQDKIAKFEELIDTLPAFWIRQISKLCAWIICILVYCIVLTTICVILNLKFYDGFYIHGIQLLGYIFANFGIPMISTWTIAYAIEKTMRPMIGWPVLLVIWYSILPFRQNLLLDDSVQFMLNQFVEEPNGNSRLLHYGLEMNFGLVARKLWFLMFSLFLYISTSLIKLNIWYRRNNKAKIAAILSFIMLVCSVPLAKISSKPHSQGVIWENSLYNSSYDQLLKEAAEPYEYKESKGEIDWLRIDIKDEKDDSLSYGVKIELNNVSGEEVIFTLYRTLDIKNVKINGLVDEKFMRNRDWVIFNIKDKGNVEIEFEVEGKIPYAFGEVSDRTLLLTYDFPWYPILGKHKVLNPMLDVIYFSNNLLGSKAYNIEINSSRGEIITNLSHAKDVCIKGRAIGPTVIQGDYESKMIDGIHFVAPPSLFKFYKNSIGVVPDILSDYKNEFAQKLDIPTGELMKKKYDQIFLVPLPEQQKNNVFKSNSSEIYINYMNWIYPIKKDPVEATEGILKRFREDLLFECFFRTGEEINSSIETVFFKDMIKVAEKGSESTVFEGLKEWYMYMGYDEEKTKVVWEKDIDDITKIEELIFAKSENEIIDKAHEILKEWVKIPKE